MKKLQRIPSSYITMSYNGLDLIKIVSSYLLLKEGKPFDEEYEEFCIKLREKIEQKYFEYVGLDIDSEIPKEEKLEKYTKILAFWLKCTFDFVADDHPFYMIATRYYGDFITEIIYRDFDCTVAKDILKRSTEIVQEYVKEQKRTWIFK